MTMNFIKYIQSADGTNLYGKINTVNNSKANVIIVHGLAEYLDRYDELAAFLNDNQFNVIRYDQRGMVVQKENLYIIIMKMKLLKIWMQPYNV